VQSFRYVECRGRGADGKSGARVSRRWRRLRDACYNGTVSHRSRRVLQVGRVERTAAGHARVILLLLLDPLHL
jgi:hypothetical protein